MFVIQMAVMLGFIQYQINKTNKSVLIFFQFAFWEKLVFITKFEEKISLKLYINLFIDKIKHIIREKMIYQS